MKLTLTSIAFVISFSAINPSTAKENDDEVFDDFDFFQEIPVVVSATRLKQSARDSPSSITVIDRDMIQASGVREIADIFNFVPGFQVGYENGTNPVVIYHGLTDQYQRRMQILIDGRSVYQPNWGGAAWANLPLVIDDIERIEIIRGPNAAAFGSNAFKATINIITQHSLSTHGTQLKAMHGDNNIAQTMLRHSGSQGDFSYRVTAAHEQDDGYLDPALGGHLGVERWDYKYVRKLIFRSDYQIDFNDILHANAGYTEGEFGERKARVYYGIKKQRYFGHFSWDHQVSDINQTNVQLYINKADDNNYFESKRLAELYSSIEDPLPLDRSESSERYELEFQQTYSPDDGFRFAWGGGTRINKVNSYYSYNTKDNITQRQHRLFVNGEINITSETLANAGVMAEKNSNSYAKYSPRLSINQHLSDSQTIRISASRAYRSPMTYEESADSRITDSGTLNDIETLSHYELEPEKITTVDFGYIFQSRGSPYSADLRVFREELRNIITPFPEVSESIGITDDFDPDPADPRNPAILLAFANHDKADLTGFETQLSYAPDKQSRVQFTYTYIDIKSTNKSHDDLLAAYGYVYNDYLYDLSAPQHAASLIAYFMPRGNLQTTISYHWVDRMKWNGGVADNLNGITYRSMVPSHDRIDLRLGMPFKKSDVEGEITFNIRNLLDDNHYDYQKHNKSQRTVYIGLLLDFN